MTAATKTIYLVWNTNMNECVGFEDRGDAVFTSTGDQSEIEGLGVPSLGDDFRERYADDAPDFVLPMTEVQVSTAAAGD